MSGSAQPSREPQTPEGQDRPAEALARRPVPPAAPITPVVPPELSNVALPFPAKPSARTPPAAMPRKRETAVLRGLKDLQQLQKQTLAVLEAVKGSLDDIQQVLRSPEATRGLEKQKNAATLLAKGFPRDAVEQAVGAVTLLPANPEAHLLLALSLAADQQADGSLAAARKGLALVDRRAHPLAIEAGLLHTLAALGCAAEAVERWSAIIDALPLPVLLEQCGCIAACFPATVDAPGNALLDGMLSARLAQPAPTPAGPRQRVRRARLIDTAPWEMPASSMLAGLDAAEAATLPLTRRAILTQVVSRLHATGSASDVLRFMTECLVPMANRGLKRATASLARAVRKRLLRLQADAPTLFRAMEKFQLAGAFEPATEMAALLTSWRKAAVRAGRARHALLLAASLFGAGLVTLAYILFVMDGWHGRQGFMRLAGAPVNPLWIGILFLALGVGAGLYGLLGPTWTPPMPEDRPPLTLEEMRFLRPLGMRQSLRAVMMRRR